MINDLWYKNAVIYCLSVLHGFQRRRHRRLQGINAKGLMRRLDYLHGLGVTAIWLMPFQVSPHRDDGYDVSDYYGTRPQALAGTSFGRAVYAPDDASRPVLRQGTFPARSRVL